MKKVILLILVIFIVSGCEKKRLVSDGVLTVDLAVEETKAVMKKDSFVMNGTTLLDSAKLAYQLEQMKAESLVESKSSVCFSVDWMFNAGVLAYSSKTGYSGSVLLEYGDNFNIKLWLSDGDFLIDGLNPDEIKSENIKEGKTASNECADIAKKGYVMCIKGDCYIK